MSWRNIAEQYYARIAELEAQLPEGMKNCTILFKECEKGHGRLTATNWIDHGCEYCRIAELEAKIDPYRGRVSELKRDLRTAVLAEREACARIAADWLDDADEPSSADDISRHIAAAIRTRPAP